MMNKKIRSIVLVILCTLFTSVAQVLYKKASGYITLDDPWALLSNYYLLGGMALYAVGAVLLIVALRHGNVSLLYPIIATSYVWVTLLSKYIFGESIEALRWLGVFSIILGISFIAFGEKEPMPLGVEA